jgi:threonylcarbamoyladenosine tRNA methylthiotransferase MtaB
VKVRFITFGCRLNRAEALEDEARFLADGWELADSSDKADMFVVRGCSVTARAQRECEKLIAGIKRKHPLAMVLIRGCLPGSVGDTVRPQPPLAGKSAAKAALPKRTARAYLKVQDGCSGNCTFCIVPKFRGKSRSESFDDLLDKSKRFIDAGYREIVVTGCNLSLYASGGKRLPELLSALAELSADVRIRPGSIEPGACARECVQAMAGKDNICRFLHIPVQSGSGRVLKAMQRPYTVEDVDELAALANSLVPGISLGCDMMTGFPGESQADFLASADLLRRCAFSNAHVFPYSERPGTPAAVFPSPIPKTLRSSRAKHLAKIAENERKRFARRFLGKQVEVLVENEKTCSGWTSQYLWFEASRPGAKGMPKRREIATFTVQEAKDGSLRGQPTTAG